MQDKRNDIELQFRKELALLEKKYEGLYEPIYEERKIITGEREATEEEYKDREGSHVQGKGKDVDQVRVSPTSGNTLSAPNFPLVFEDDHDALKYLVDIKSERLIDEDSAS